MNTKIQSLKSSLSDRFARALTFVVGPATRGTPVRHTADELCPGSIRMRCGDGEMFWSDRGEARRWEGRRLAFAASWVACLSLSATAQQLSIINANKTLTRVDVATGTATTTDITGLAGADSIVGAKRNYELQGIGPNVVLQTRIVTDEQGATGRYQLAVTDTTAAATNGCQIQGGGWYPTQPPLVGWNSNTSETMPQNPYNSLLDSGGYLYGAGTCNSGAGSGTQMSFTPATGDISGVCGYQGDMLVLKRSGSQTILSRVHHYNMVPFPGTTPPPAITQTWNVTDLTGSMQIMGITVDCGGRLWAYVNRPGSCQGHGWGDLILARTDEALTSSTLTLRTQWDIGDWFNGGVGCLYFGPSFLFFDVATQPSSISATATTICSGQSTTLTANGGQGVAVNWHSGSCTGTLVGTGASLTVSPANTTTYYASYDSGLGCSSGCASQTITVNASNQWASPTIVASSTTVCAGTPVTLTAVGGSGAALNWYQGPTAGSGPILFTGPSYTFTPGNTSTYSARWESTTCPASPQASITIAVGLPLSISATATTICAGDPVNLLANGAGSGTVTWHAGSMTGTVIGTGASILLHPTATTQYFAVLAPGICPAADMANVTITVNALPVQLDSITASTLTACTDSIVLLTAVGGSGGSGGSVNWYRDSCGSAVHLGSGSTMTVSSAASGSVTYFARWESSTCGDSNCKSVTITYSPAPTNPTAASVSPSSVCPNTISVSLSAGGGSGTQFVWHAGSISGPVVGTGQSALIPAPTATTTYYGVWESACANSLPVTVQVNFRPYPSNDDCVNAEPVFIAAPAPAFTLVPFSTACAVTDGPPHAACNSFGDYQVKQDIWFRYVATTTGTLRVSTCYPGSATFNTKLAIYRDAGCPVTDASLLTCADDSGSGCAPQTTVQVPVDNGSSYLIRVGSYGTASGDGVLDFMLTPAPLCPPPGLMPAVTFTLCGDSAQIPWSWSIRSTTNAFQEMSELNAGPANAGNAFQVATAFAGSINNLAGQLGCGATLFATAIPFGGVPCGGSTGMGSSTAMLSISSSSPFELRVGPVGVAASCLVDATGLPCTFNPEMALVPLPGADCNRNGIDDLIDLAMGTSNDADGDSIPDECVVEVGTKYCFGDGNGIGCPCGNQSSPGEQAGCRNSLGMGGALTASGQASISNDTVVLRGSSMTNSSALYLQGTSQIATPFGDGLRCAGGSVVRLGILNNANGSSIYPPSGAASVSVRGQVNSPGSVRMYQVWYRDSQSFCTPSPFNLTNGVRITWTP